MPGAQTGERRVAVTLLTVALTIGVMALLLTRIDLEGVRQSLAGVDYRLLGVAILVSLGLQTVQTAVVLRQTLRGFGHEISFAASMETIVGNLAIHGALPAGTGSVVRMAYLRRTHGVQLGAAAAALISIHWFKLIWLVLLSAVGWWLHGTGARGPAVLVSAVLLGMLAVTAVLPRLSRRFAGSRGPGRFGDALRALADLAEQLRPRALWKGALQTLPIIAGQLGNFAVLVAALGASVDATLIVAALPVCMIGAKIPVTFMGIGAREALVVVLMASMAEPGVLMAAGLLLSLVDHIIPALVGTLFTRRFLVRLFEGQ